MGCDCCKCQKKCMNTCGKCGKEYMPIEEGKPYFGNPNWCPACNGIGTNVQWSKK